MKLSKEQYEAIVGLIKNEGLCIDLLPCYKCPIYNKRPKICYKNAALANAKKLIKYLPEKYQVELMEYILCR